jgi:hypothetical protein
MLVALRKPRRWGEGPIPIAIESSMIAAIEPAEKGDPNENTLITMMGGGYMFVLDEFTEVCRRVSEANGDPVLTFVKKEPT